MATVYHQLHPEGAQFDDDTYPQYLRSLGTNFPVSGLAYDASADEFAVWKFRAVEYGSGNLTLDIEWYADTASANDVVWGAQIAVITPNSDTQDVETDAFATANTVTDTHLATTGQRVHRATITISNLDSLAADDLVFLKIYRDADNASDDMTGDAILLLATVSYSDT
jgi:hypothetical protein